MVRVLRHAITRTVLSVAIIASLLPAELLSVPDPWFLILFAPEFCLRVIVACRADLRHDTRRGFSEEPERKWAAPRLSDVIWLLADLLALLTFLPVPHAIAPARWLRLFRLLRMVLLLRYWSAIADDLWQVMLRRERARQVVLMGFIVLILSFAGAVVLDHGTQDLAVDFDGDYRADDEDDRDFWVRLWWAFRQVQDPGNMISGPEGILVLAVSLVLTVSGLFLVSFLIGLGTDVVAELMALSRLRAPGLQGHTVLVNVGPPTRQLFYELERHYGRLVMEGRRMLAVMRPREIAATLRRRKRRRFVVAGRPEEPPDFLREPEFRNVFYRQITNSPADRSFLDKADVLSAGRVILLADTNNTEPDNETILSALTVVRQIIKHAPEETDPRPRKVVAEIVDESNLFAARKALRAEDPRGVVQSQIVATERLLALFIGCLARRPGVTDLLVGLLRATELYSYDFEYWRLGAAIRRPRPDLPEDPERAFARIMACGRSDPELFSVLPIGVLVDSDGDDTVELIIHPRPGLPAAPCRGYVVVAPSFGLVERFQSAVERGPPARLIAPSTPMADVQFSASPPASIRRVLVCGFRRATVTVLESLLCGDPDAEILVLVESEAQLELAHDTIHSHARLSANGLLEPSVGAFVVEDGRVRYRRHGETARGFVDVAIGDATSSRRLIDLPNGFGSAWEMSLVIVVADERSHADAKTTTVLMKLEALFERHATSQPGRVIAEVRDEELADSLTERYRNARAEVCVVSIQRIRSLLVFQSVVVPHLDLVYRELLAPWGHSFVRFDFQGGARGRVTFDDLAAVERKRNRILLALLLERSDGTTHLSIAGAGLPDRTVELERVRGAWMIAVESADLPTSNAVVVASPT
jgi:hypothetical protein